MSMITPLLLLSGLIGAHAQTSRTITFKNSCSKDVWLTPTSGSSGTCAAGCPESSTCNTDNGYCYFDNPTPSSGTYRITAGGTNTIVYPFYNNGIDTQWNGNYAFCEDGMTCNQDAATCDSNGCGVASGPYALAEFDFSKTGSDFYDISAIAGVSVPFSITPESPNLDSSNPYTCGNPGSSSPSAGLGAASWKVTVPSVEYQWVTPSSATPTTCSADSDCGSGENCGLVYSSGAFNLVCGALSGYWTAGSVCGINGGTTYMNCASALTNGPYTGTDSAFYGCGDTSGSCYQPGADTACCGCVNWQDVLASGAVPSSTELCVNTNPTWTSIVQPTIQFLKTGCPNCYTFPYDDMSSTFTCSNVVGGYNNQNYTIEARTQIEGAVKGSPVVLFMKGTPDMPQCGFSRAAIQVLDLHGVPPEKMKTYNVLEDQELRNGIKEYSDWPTIPQLYVSGEFVGGCDILLGMHQSGELATLLESKDVIPKAAPAEAESTPAS
ncbi:hypothetical protein HWV62_6921 [Athelia sp. TMB]|nr:hypothetical protein HWV62_6921 [Athelia sp. TMB]